MNFALFCFAFNVKKATIQSNTSEICFSKNRLVMDDVSYPLNTIKYNPELDSFETCYLQKITLLDNNGYEIPVQDSIICAFISPSARRMTGDQLIKNVNKVNIAVYHTNYDGTSTPCICTMERLTRSERLRIKFGEVEMLLYSSQELYCFDNKFYLIDSNSTIHEFHSYDISPIVFN